MPTFISNKTQAVHKTSRQADTQPISRNNLSISSLHSRIQKIFEPRISDQALADFFDQLATLLASGVTLVSALSFIQNSSRIPRLRQALRNILEHIRGGESFSNALSSEGRIFDRVVLGMVQAAESSGHLETVASELALAFGRKAEAKSQLLQAVTYPLFVVFFGVVTAIVLIVFVIPKIAGVFELWDTPLPFATRALLAFSRFVGQWAVLITVLGGSILFFLHSKMKIRFRKIGFEILEKTPLISRIIFLNDFVRLNRTWGMLVRSGVPLLEALRSSIHIVASEAIRHSLEKIEQKTLRGARFQEALEDEPWIPELAKNFIRVGEETGTLDASFEKVAVFYERELKNHLKTVSTLIEPCFILIVGLGVGLLVMCLLLPIFDMSLMVQ